MQFTVYQDNILLLIITNLYQNNITQNSLFYSLLHVKNSSALMTKINSRFLEVVNHYILVYSLLNKRNTFLYQYYPNIFKLFLYYYYIQFPFKVLLFLVNNQMNYSLLLHLLIYLYSNIIPFYYIITIFIYAIYFSLSNLKFLLFCNRIIFYV